MVPTSLTTSATIFFLLLLAIPICLEAKPLKLKQTQVVFYMHDWETGANVTAIPIAGLPKKPWAVGRFATIIDIDDALPETIVRNSAQIGRAQGIYVNSALDGSDLHFLMSVVFTNKQYNGSSLEIQGADRFFNKYREVSVVSGTGMFRPVSPGLCHLGACLLRPTSFQRHHSLECYGSSLLNYMESGILIYVFVCCERQR